MKKDWATLSGLATRLWHLRNFHVVRFDDCQLAPLYLFKTLASSKIRKLEKGKKKWSGKLSMSNSCSLHCRSQWMVGWRYRQKTEWQEGEYEKRNINPARQTQENHGQSIKPQKQGSLVPFFIIFLCKSFPY